MTENFIQWMINRLIYKHSYAEDDIIIQSLYKLKDYHIRHQSIQITDVDLDKIISKYYTDFYFDKSEDFKIGFTDEDREILRTTIRSITNDILGTIN